jgi:hypothetical protein
VAAAYSDGRSWSGLVEGSGDGGDNISGVRERGWLFGV